MNIRHFLRSEDAAVTVDWVVMTAAVTGMGLAVTAVVSGGIENVSGDILDTLTQIEIVDEFVEFVAVTLANQDFAGGDAGDWTGANAQDMGGDVGELLVVGPGGTASLTLNVPSGADQVTFTFDLIGGDSLDSETATVMINGEPVTYATGNHGAMSVSNQSVDGVSVSTSVQSENQQMGGSSNDGWNESVTTVSITVDNPGSSVTLGVASNADQGTDDEFFGVDNLQVDAT